MADNGAGQAVLDEGASEALMQRRRNGRPIMLPP